MARSDFLDFDCLAYATRRTGRAVTNLFNSRLAHLDLNVAQFGLLAAVAKLPGSTLAAIGESMLLDESTLARNFTVLERRELVEAEGGRGRGGKHLTLTRAGKKLHAEAMSIWLETNRDLASELGIKDAEAGRQFLRALGKLSERLKTEDGAAGRKSGGPHKIPVSQRSS
ncbi:MAG: MarR family winged helix-turn-helix transcriptional regulator [Hyphomonadaceae bacterium]|nr:MarR family winged helix-turn-helix transcriptional regulator [Hyphomonadaceae bacterium]